jgi:hypothetical protein
LLISQLIYAKKGLALSGVDDATRKDEAAKAFLRTFGLEDAPFCCAENDTYGVVHSAFPDGEKKREAEIRFS